MIYTRATTYINILQTVPHAVTAAQPAVCQGTNPSAAPGEAPRPQNENTLPLMTLITAITGSGAMVA